MSSRRRPARAVWMLADPNRRSDPGSNNFPDGPVSTTAPVSAAPSTSGGRADAVGTVEIILGYNFNNPMLLREALTHSSYHHPMKGGITYERLEFIGDAVLSCVMAREVFTSYPELSPGPLSKLRATNVDNEKLARIAVEQGLHRFLRHKTPKLERQIQNFMKGILKYPIHSNGLIDDTPKVLADIVESVIGAVFVDSNSCLETVWKVFKRLSTEMITPETLGQHPVSELSEFCHKKGMQLKFQDRWWWKNKRIEVLVNGELVGSATHGHKKIAQNRAAKAALEQLKTAPISSTIDCRRL